mmetsp:Transcript_14292/g.43934  ORF Transcript_14292/g.43934 Transcript_14292/m.43934 type:complete len:82 (-) Transcript_14292:25-270(-)
MPPSPRESWYCCGRLSHAVCLDIAGAQPHAIPCAHLIHTNKVAMLYLAVPYVFAVIRFLVVTPCTSISISTFGLKISHMRA